MASRNLPEKFKQYDYMKSERYDGELLSVDRAANGAVTFNNKNGVGTWDSFIKLSRTVCGYGSPVAKLGIDGECSYLFNTLEAITCKDSNNLARKTLEKWFDNGWDGTTVAKRFDTAIHDIASRSSVDRDDVDIDSLQVGGAEYGMMCCLADTEFHGVTAQSVSEQCASLLGRRFALTLNEKLEVDFGRDIAGDISKLLASSAGLDFSDQKRLVGIYVEKVLTCNKILQDKACLGLIKEKFLDDRGFLDEKKLSWFVNSFDGKGIQPKFQNRYAEATTNVLASMASGNFPGLGLDKDGKGCSIETPQPVFLSFAGAGKSVVPKAELFASLALNTKGRFNSDLTRGGPFIFIEGNDMTRNLRLIAKEEDVEAAKKGDVEADKRVRPLSPMRFYFVMEKIGANGQKVKALSEREFFSVDSVLDKDFQRSLVGGYDKLKADLEEEKKKFLETGRTRIDASGCRDFRQYLACVMTASRLGVPFFADRDTVMTMRNEAQKMRMVFSNPKMTKEINDFWKGVDESISLGKCYGKEPSRSVTHGVSMNQHRELGSGYDGY